MKRLWPFGLRNVELEIRQFYLIVSVTQLNILKLKLSELCCKIFRKEISLQVETRGLQEYRKFKITPEIPCILYNHIRWFVYVQSWRDAEDD